MPPSDKHNTITKKSKVKWLGPHSPIFISQRPCPCLCPYLLKTLHQMFQLLFLLLSHMKTDDCSQLPLVVPTPFEAAKYIETPYQDLIQCFYVSIKGGVCVYTWDRCFLVSHVSIGVWEMDWLHKNHWAVGALLGGGPLESATSGGGLLETKANVSVGCLSGYFCGWLTCLMGGWLSCWMARYPTCWLTSCLLGLFVYWSRWVPCLNGGCLVGLLVC